MIGDIAYRLSQVNMLARVDRFWTDTRLIGDLPPNDLEITWEELRLEFGHGDLETLSAYHGGRKVTDYRD